MAEENDPVPLNYRTPAPTPPARPMLTLERIAAGAFFGAVLLGFFGCLCPFEAFHALSIPAYLLLMWAFKAGPAAASEIWVFAHLITGAVIGMLVAGGASIVIKIRDSKRDS